MPIFDAAQVDDVPARNLLAGWVACWLEPQTGRLLLGEQNDPEARHLVRGFLYKVGRRHNNAVKPLNDQEALHYPAFPPVCPCCGEDYRYSSQNTYRLFPKGSPIRTFRTGFTKVSQTFAKELFHALPTRGGGSDDRKLIVFSDSREDAAKISNDIERYHFDDMMRDTLYAELRVSVLGKSELAHAARTGTNESPLARQFGDRFPDEADALRRSGARLRELAPQVPNIINTPVFSEFLQVSNILNNAEVAASGRVPIAILYSDMVGQMANTPILIQRLKNLGINPSGYMKEFQTYKRSYQQNGHERHAFAEWWKMFNFDHLALFQNYTSTEGNVTFDAAAMDGQGMRGIIRQNILSLVFGKLYFGFESSGLGRPSVHISVQEVTNILVQCGLNIAGFNEIRLLEVCDTVVRLLGEKHSYEQQVPKYGVGPAPVIDAFGQGAFGPKRKLRHIVNYCNRIAELHGLNPAQLEQAVRNVVNRGNTQNWILHASELDLHLAKDSDPVWKCTSCQRVHLHRSGGICSHCMEPLNNASNRTCEQLWTHHYYANGTARDREPFRLHAEELTGQTDDQAERQRHFRNIVLKGQKRVEVIDLLSVTTTMEVGIDIGGLRAVMQANMPPERFNYQQRAGRGGRRGQAYSVVMTLCRQRSHDTLHFEDPTAITSSPAPTPFLAMDHLDIAKRIIAKGVLRKAFVDAGVLWHHGPRRPPDSHGEFGFATIQTDNQGAVSPGWAERRTAIESWIAAPANQDYITRLANRLVIAVNGTEVTSASLFSFVTTNLCNKIDELVTNEELYSFEGLAERLAEGALLPMFGMPSKVRRLYHGQDKPWLDEVPYIDRELDLAVTEFAPGAQKTKDKRIHQAVGFCPDLVLTRKRGGKSVNAIGSTPFLLSRWMARCIRCHYVKTSDVVANQQTSNECPNCGASTDLGYGEFQVRTPAAFFTEYLSSGEDAREDADIVQAPAARLAEIPDADPQQVPTLNAVSAFRADGRLYTLNDNAGELFTGGATTDDRIRGRAGDGIIERWVANPNGGEEIGLVAPKTSDALAFRVNRVPLGLELSPVRPLPRDVDGNNPNSFVRPGVNSALASAAFLIRSVAADNRDIDPEEFDICHIRLASVGHDQTSRERFTGEFIIADHLPNGSGFTRWLNENLAMVLNKIVHAADTHQFTEEHGSFLPRIFGQDHSGSCKWSCYSCMKNFRNMRYHPLLDWKLGTSMVRILVDENEAVGLDGNWQKLEIRGWLQSVQHDVARFVHNFENGGPAGFMVVPETPLPTFTFGDYCVVIRHPLWDTFNPRGVFVDALAIAAEIKGQTNVLSVDSFDLSRRPSWVFQKLLGDETVFRT